MTEGEFPTRFSRRTFAVALLISIVGLMLVAWGMLTQGRVAFLSYLAAFAFWLSIALGGLLFLMIQHAMDSTWFVSIRRLAETITAPLVALAILFVPLLPGLRLIYPWAGPGPIEPGAAALPDAANVYLQLPFFRARAAVYFAIWLAASYLLRRWSVLQSAHDAVALARRQRVLSAGLLPLAGFALTFAAFDWLMSLDPHWYSTIFGVYWFAGGVLAAVSLLALLAFLARRHGRLTTDVSISHVHALGKLMLVFVIFWAYIAFAQFFLIWIADVPAEVRWYAARIDGRWRGIAAMLLVGHFAVPFFALLSWRLKRSPPLLAAVGVWLLVMHYLDVYWLVLPTLGAPAGPSWLDAASLAGIGGAAIAYALWWLDGLPLVPLGDPRLARSRRFHTA
jgi:hypothetical protein